MRELKVPFIHHNENESINEKIDALVPGFIDFQPWESYRDNAKAKFAIAYSSDFIFLKFYVKEKSLRAFSREYNGTVHKDNCVEFFVSFEGDKGYYNIEFNCLGYGKIAYGTERNNRIFLNEELIRKINIQQHIFAGKGEDVEWSLLLEIPKETFLYSKISSFKGLKAKANFYKCGDGLPKPHFLAWNNIEVPEPDFHRPEFFGNIYFE